MKIITADQRLAEAGKGGAKILIIGPCAGPKVDQRHQEPPAPPAVRPWWSDEKEEPPF